MPDSPGLSDAACMASTTHTVVAAAAVAAAAAAVATGGFWHCNRHGPSRCHHHAVRRGNIGTGGRFTIARAAVRACVTNSAGHSLIPVHCLWAGSCRCAGARRAHLRYLLATAARAHCLPDGPHYRYDGQRRCRAAAVSRERKCLEADPHVHQQPRRRGDCGLVSLRHHAVHARSRADTLSRPSVQHGIPSAGGRTGGPADRSAARTHHDPPAVGERSRTSVGYCDCGALQRRIAARWL